jgi:N-formylglutamate deformylase
MTDWLVVHRGSAPLVLSIPHAGVIIPPDVASGLRSPWLSLKDTDWYIPELYEQARELDVTIVRTCISRTVIDVNRDPSGRSLYPGQTTTGLCPLTTFDGEPLYHAGAEPDAVEIARRRGRYFDVYHEALSAELERLRALHGWAVLYDAHSIRSRMPTLFEGLLPQFNIGTNGGASCAAAMTAAVERVCAATHFTRITNGRFRGGWITRHHGQPSRHIHAIQMELAMRGYLREPSGAETPDNWPPDFSVGDAAELRPVLMEVLRVCLEFNVDQKRNAT